MAKKTKEPKVVKTKDEELLVEVQDHQKDSFDSLTNVRGTWDDLESLLICELEDDTSKNSENKVFDPRLSTIVYERAARVMAQTPKGKAYAVSKNDLGKNVLMNLLLGYFEKNANEQMPLLMKLRLWDLYSLVYGSMFALVPWRVNKRNGYIGPELNILNIRDCFPQPGVRSVEEMDWFTVGGVATVDWLKNQDQDTWKNIDKLEVQLKEEKSSGDKIISKDDKSYVERNRYPNDVGDVVYPRVRIYTEYRTDKWITWTPQRVNKETSKPFVLRVVDNPYPDGKLPIVAKHAFPLIDSPIGLGEFARGKSLQFALNSLINLYLTGVKYSIFPPLHINLQNVVPSSLKWGAGEKWFMNNPNQDVQTMQITPQGLNTFQSTYSFMLSSLYNMSGTTEVNQSSDNQPAMGKTPEAVRFIANREGARDEWDRFMMEEALKQVYDRWITLAASKLETDVEIRLFGDEIKEIEEAYPDVTELFESKKRGRVKISRALLNDSEEEPTHYDFELEAGSTFKKDITAEQSNITAVMKAVLENPAIIQSIQQKGGDIDLAELFKRWLISGDIKDWEKIIIEPPEEEASEEMESLPQEEIPEEVLPQEPVEQMPQEEPVQEVEFNDADIGAVANELLNGIQGIPPSA